MDLEEEQPPIFVAETNFPRHILALFRPLSFVSKAHVTILSDGVRISVEDSRVMQAHAFLNVPLFRTYAFQPPPRENEDGEEEEEEADACCFQISLTAFLESLQIICSTLEPPASKYSGSSFNSSSDNRTHGYNSGGGVTATLDRGGPAAMFDAQTLRAAEYRGKAGGEGAICKFMWGGPESEGGFVMSMEDPVVTTTCTLTTYTAEGFNDTEIDLTPGNVALKVIMKSFWLHDALTELEASAPSRLIIHASTNTPYLVLEGTGGTTSNSKVEFLTKDANVLETFDLPMGEGSSNVYKFDMIKNCMKALAVAFMVSIRIDVEGVLSIQFMVKNQEGQGMEGKESSFLDFRFLPFDLRGDDD
ncbi:Rad1-domain-containing protein [Ascobolus immersus RN42]|uniref:Rad1-domain-containing protein n=1 Tax=Ascobolus immersus RN42 TaxID=1160509 RepID=A0A3N4IE30_ASCIM|nr:Rad1-domain-containing protein [Ascobolus immersus RN42]